MTANKKLLPLTITVAAAFAALAPSAAAAANDQGDFIVRARAVYLQSANDDSTGLDLSINDKVLPDVDFTYFLSPNLATELVLTYPQRQTIYAGSTAIGTLKHLPPVLTLQYHFTGMSVRPYVGAGVNWTHFSDVKFDAATTAALGPSLKSNSFGLAAQVGLDVPLGGGWLINADLKYVQIKTDVSSFGTKVGEFKVNPMLYGIGVGKRF